MANVMRIGGGGGQPNVLTVAVDTGAIVTATNGDKTVVGTSVGGNAVLKLPKAGIWSLLAELNGQTTEDSIVIVDDYPVEVSFGLPLSSLAEGALVKINENGSGVNFYLAKHDYESGLNGAGRELLVRKDCYDTRNWHSSNLCEYSTSGIDTWLNGTYKGLLDASVQSLIGSTSFYYFARGVYTIKTLNRSIFLLSMTELGDTGALHSVTGTALPIANTLKVAHCNGSAVGQWSRSPKYGSSTMVVVMTSDGGASEQACTATFGSRPAFTLPNTLFVNPTPNADGSYTLMV